MRRKLVKNLGEKVWITDTEAEMVALATTGIREPGYSFDEIQAIKSMVPEMRTVVHAIKKISPGTAIIQN